MLTRAATRATPRGWLAHIALAPVHEQGWEGQGPLVVCDGAVLEHAPNLSHLQSAAGRSLAESDLFAVAVAPLAWLKADHVSVWTVDVKGVGQTTVRRSSVLDAVLDQLPGPAREVGALLDDLGATTAAARDAVTGFLRHLVSLGVLRCSVHSARMRDERPHVALFGRAPLAGVQDGYLDVYRRTKAGLSPGYCARLIGTAHLAARLVALIDAGSPLPTAIPAGVSERPQGVLDLAAIRNGLEGPAACA